MTTDDIPEGDGDQTPQQDLPPAPTPEDVAHIAALYEESKAYMDSAKAKLETREPYMYDTFDMQTDS